MTPTAFETLLHCLQPDGSMAAPNILHSRKRFCNQFRTLHKRSRCTITECRRGRGTKRTKEQGAGKTEVSGGRTGTSQGWKKAPFLAGDRDVAGRLSSWHLAQMEPKQAEGCGFFAPKADANSAWIILLLVRKPQEEGSRLPLHVIDSRIAEMNLPRAVFSSAKTACHGICH